MLAVASDADDDIEIRCTSGTVRVNTADPDNGAFACGAVQSIAVTGGPGANAITVGNDFAGSNTFPNLLQQAAQGVPAITIQGGGGDDVIIGMRVHPVGVLVVIDGGPGNDSYNAGCCFSSAAGPTRYVFQTASAPEADLVFAYSETNGSNPEILDFSALAAGDPIRASLIHAPGQPNVTHTNRTVSMAPGFVASDLNGIVGTPGNDTITGNLRANALTGGGGNDLLAGGDGDDTLDGGPGNDTLEGGLGTNVLIGGDGNDTLNGSPNRDTLEGGAGNDSMDGGGGVDRYVFAPAAAPETDTVTAFTQNANTESLDFGALAANDPLLVDFTPADGVTVATHTNRIVKVKLASQAAELDAAVGGAAADQMSGNQRANVLEGGPGNDVLDGGGNIVSVDTYVFKGAPTSEVDTLVDPTSDIVDFGALDAATPVDVDLSSATTLVATHANRTVHTAVAGAAASMFGIVGGAGDDTLVGNAGGNSLTGGSGSDALDGRGSGDGYHFDDTDTPEVDTIDEPHLESSLSFERLAFNTPVTILLTPPLLAPGTTIAMHANRAVRVSDPSHAGSFERVTGGAGSDDVTGNALDNIFRDAGGNDTYRGGPGEDRFQEATDSGRDRYEGGPGNDRYEFGCELDTFNTDTVVELASEGTDLLNLSDADCVFASAFVIDLTNDAAMVSFSKSVKTGAAGQAANFEDVIGTDGKDTFTGNAANNLFLSGTGIDALAGGAGDDLYCIGGGRGSQTATITELPGGGTDTIQFSFCGQAALITNLVVDLEPTGVQIGSATWDFQGNRSLVLRVPDAAAAANLEHVIGTPAADDLRGNALPNVLSGLEGNDMLDGRGGSDELNGAEGDDTLLSRGGGIDTDNCGDGIDAAFADAGDVVNADCEATNPATPTAATPTVTPTTGGGPTPTGPVGTPTATRSRTPTPVATRTPAPEQCADCIDNDFDGAIDRADGQCPQPADGAGVGLAADTAKGAVACGKVLAKVGTSFALKRVKALGACLLKTFVCVQQKASDPGCLAAAGKTCAKAEAARVAALAKLAASVAKKCDAPALAATDLRSALGLGFAEETAGCGDFDVPVLDDAGDVATCLARRHGCRAEALVGTALPRARELLALAGRDPAADAACLPPGGSGGSGADGKGLVKCQKGLAKASAAYAGARLNARQKCRAAVFTCVQLKPTDPKCLPKADGVCAKLDAKVEAAAAKLANAVAKTCGSALVLADLLDGAGVGFDLRGAECAALGITALDSVGDVSACLTAQHDCRVDQLLEGQIPRASELESIRP